MADKRDEERRVRGDAAVQRSPEERRGTAPEHGHFSLAGLHDLDDLSALRKHRTEQAEPEYESHQGPGPDVENMEPLRAGYGPGSAQAGVPRGIEEETEEKPVDPLSADELSHRRS